MKFISLIQKLRGRRGGWGGVFAGRKAALSVHPPCVVLQIHSPASLQRRCWPSTQPPSSQTSSSRGNSVGGRAQVSPQRRTRPRHLREPQVLFLLPPAPISSSKWPEVPAGSMAPAHRACLIENSDARCQLRPRPRHLALRVQVREAV